MSKQKSASEHDDGGDVRANLNTNFSFYLDRCI